MRYLRCLIFAALCGFIGAAVSQTPSNVFVGNIIGPYTSVSSLSASVCGTSAAPQGTLGVVITSATDKGIYYCDSAGWSNTIGYLPSVTLTMPTSAVLLGCGTASTIAIPNATNFTVTPNQNPGNVNVQYWITGASTSGALANVAYCTALVSVTPASVTYLIKPFSR